MIDDETRSYWDHITGTCVTGELTGKQLPNWPIEMTTVAAHCQHHPDTPLYRSRPTWIGRMMGRLERIMQGRFPPGFRSTMGPADARLPEMEIGLGVVTDSVRRFYPKRILQTPRTETIDGRELTVQIDADTGVPLARWEDDSRPFQLFTRWYGFSYTYPDCTVAKTTTPRRSISPDPPP